MSDRKLRIQPHRYGGESAVISLRLPKDMLAVIDRVPAGMGCPARIGKEKAPAALH